MGQLGLSDEDVEFGQKVASDIVMQFLQRYRAMAMPMLVALAGTLAQTAIPECPEPEQLLRVFVKKLEEDVRTELLETMADVTPQ